MQVKVIGRTINTRQSYGGDSVDHVVKPTWNCPSQDAKPRIKYNTYVSGNFPSEKMLISRH